MDRSKNFEKVLPNDYVLVKHVDAKADKRITVIYSLLALVPPVVLVPVFCIIASVCSGYNLAENFDDEYGLLRFSVICFVVCIVMILYIILHEITHGITYKCFTGAKLKFGMTLTVAFCGVPDIYVRKKASIASLAMPFTVFGVIFGVFTAVLWLVSPLYGIMAGFVLAVHLGGCVGDLHWIFMYSFTKFRHCNTLMRDTGPEQWLYVPQSQAIEYGIPYAAQAVC